jgi:Predicted membrane protein
VTATHIVWGWLVLINLITLAAFRHDKQRAIHGGPRIRERDLLILAAIGGTIGAWLGMHLFRHKTRKDSFSMALFLIAAAQCALIIFLDLNAWNISA